MSQPLVSICIPSYNREAMALDALQVLDQPGFLPFRFEVVLVDNASSASDYASVRRFEPRHYALRYVRLPHTIDAFANLIGSLRRAAGTFCLYLADDDRLEPGNLAHIVEVMAAEQDVVATYAMWDYFDLTEQRIVQTGALLDDVRFTEQTAAQPLETLLHRRVLTETGVYRTAHLAATLLPSRLHYWSYILVARQLRQGAIRLSSRPFYRYVSRRADDTFPRLTVASRMSQSTWETMDRGIDLWSRYLPATEHAAASPNAASAAMKIGLRELSLSAAVTDNRLIEGFDIALALSADRSYQLPMTSEAIQHLCIRAAIEAVHDIYQSVPELSGICTDGFAAGFPAFLAANFTTLTSGRPVPVVAPPLTPETAGRHLILTMRETQRHAYIAGGCAPALVYSFERLLQVYSPANLPPPRHTTQAQTVA
ncbi:MAG: glycosyltransferase [Pseudomonadota bacterium]